MLPCGGGNYCCFDLNNSDCCSTSSSIFHLGAATVVTTATAVPTSITLSSSVAPVAAHSTTTNQPSPSLNTSTTSALPTSTSSQKQGSHDQVGIGVGVGVGVAAGISAIGAILYFRSRQQSSNKQKAIPLASSYADSPRRQLELPNQVSQAHELSGVQSPLELQAAPQAHELGGRDTGIIK